MKTLYIHVGSHKTGSSAIQAFLTLNSELIKTKGFLFPNPPVFDQAYQTSGGNVAEFYSFFVNNQTDRIINFLEKFENENNVILSAESLIRVLKDYKKEFFEVFRKYDYKIICYIRRQDQFISSFYNQLVKSHDCITERIEIVNNEQFFPYDVSTILIECLKYTDKNNIIVRPYEKKQFYNDNIYEDFLNILGLELTNDYIMPDKVVNPSLNSNALEFRRILNLLEVDKGQILLKYKMNKVLADYSVWKGGGQPFQSESIITPKQSSELIKLYKEQNSSVAKQFLDRQDGTLFYEELPSEDTISLDKLDVDTIFDICKYIIAHDKSNIDVEELATNLISYTSNSFLGIDWKFREGYKSYQKFKQVYCLNEPPIICSPHIQECNRINEEFQFRSIGCDPYFIMSGFNNQKGFCRFVLEVDITLPQSTVVQCYYKGKDEDYNEKLSDSESLASGRHQASLYLEHSIPVEEIRFDIGCCEGDYLIHSLKVLAYEQKENTITNENKSKIPVW